MTTLATARLTYAEVVRVTAAALDDLRPRWYDAVDLATLNMRTMDRCVGGQVFGYHGDAFTALCAVLPHEQVRVALSYYCPAALWRREVLARRDADARADVRARVLAVAPTRAAWLADVAALRDVPLVVDPHEPWRVADRTRGEYELVPALAPGVADDRVVLAYPATTGATS